MSDNIYQLYKNSCGDMYDRFLELDENEFRALMECVTLMYNSVYRKEKHSKLYFKLLEFEPNATNNTK